MKQNSPAPVGPLPVNFTAWPLPMQRRYLRHALDRHSELPRPSEVRAALYLSIASLVSRSL